MISNLGKEVEKGFNQSVNIYHNDLEKDQQDQLYTGKDRFKQDIHPSYAPSTKILKKRKGQPIDRVTWKDSGKLYRTLQIKGTGNAMEYIINVPQSKYLLLDYGSNTLGLQHNTLDTFVLNKSLNVIKNNIDGRLSKHSNK